MVQKVKVSLRKKHLHLTKANVFKNLKCHFLILKMAVLAVNQQRAEHDVMEHNMKKLAEKGYDYDIKMMASYYLHIHIHSVK